MVDFTATPPLIILGKAPQPWGGAEYGYSRDLWGAAVQSPLQHSKILSTE